MAFNIGKNIIFNSGAMFYMWRVDREMQWACFRNVEIASRFNIDGHGRHSVTPEQVISIAYIITFILEQKGN